MCLPAVLRAPSARGVGFRMHDTRAELRHIRYLHMVGSGDGNKGRHSNLQRKTNPNGNENPFSSPSRRVFRPAYSISFVMATRIIDIPFVFVRRTFTVI